MKNNARPILTNTVQKVVIFGAAEFAEVACAYLEHDDRFEVAAFTVHESYIKTPQLLGYDVVPFERIDDRFPPSECSMLVAVGYKRLNRARAELYWACKARGYSLITYVSPTTMHAGHYEIGDNCFALDGNVIEPFVRIGNNVVIWSFNHIGHHSTIGDHCFITGNVGIAGRVTIGEGCFIGGGALIADGVTIAPRCIIGSGTMITKDTKEGEVYRIAPIEPSPYPSHKWRI